MHDCKSRLQALKQVHVQKEINRLVKEYGEEELMKLINNASANDNPPDSDEGVG
jgi:N-methylhydantoinase B/oxoprolinase/acetone carboxylase alpha subunit